MKNSAPGHDLSGPGASRRSQPYWIRRIFHWFGKAIHQFDLIQPGDRILVGVSGIDSLCLLWLLRERLQWIPVQYEIKAVFVDPGFDKKMAQVLTGYLEQEGYDFSILKTDIGPRAHGPENRENPCFLCSRERRKRLFTLLEDLHYQKLALGHHLDDINATLLINILYGGSISTMLPRQEFFGGQVTIIRPLALLAKEQLEKLARYLAVPLISNPCPSAKTSQRQEVNAFLASLYRKDRRIRYNIFQAMRNVRKEYLPE